MSYIYQPSLSSDPPCLPSFCPCPYPSLCLTPKIFPTLLPPFTRILLIILLPRGRQKILLRASKNEIIIEKNWHQSILYPEKFLTCVQAALPRYRFLSTPASPSLSLNRRTCLLIEMTHHNEHFLPLCSP